MKLEIAVRSRRASISACTARMAPRRISSVTASQSNAAAPGRRSISDERGMELYELAEGTWDPTVGRRRTAVNRPEPRRTVLSSSSFRASVQPPALVERLGHASILRRYRNHYIHPEEGRRLDRVWSTVLSSLNRKESCEVRRDRISVWEGRGRYGTLLPSRSRCSPQV